VTATIVTFGGVALANPAPFNEAPGVISNETLLLSGDVDVQTSPKTKFRRQFQCYTQDYSDISALVALVGQKATLIIDGISYTNCSIHTFDKIQQVAPGVWTYDLTFTRSTA
jgi:hypothetical protein